MSKKDYELIAEAMLDLWLRGVFNNWVDYVEAVGVMANRLALKNDRFNTKIFIAACGVPTNA